MFNLRKKILFSFISSLMILSLACSDPDPFDVARDKQISSLLLTRNDFPKGWIVKKAGKTINAKQEEFMNTQNVSITLEIHETDIEAMQFFSSKKDAIHKKIEERGISGDELMDINKDSMFVWMQSQSGFEPYISTKWEVIGIYGNVTLQVIDKGGMTCCRKDFAVNMAKKQMDKIKNTSVTAIVKESSTATEALIVPPSTPTSIPVAVIVPTPTPLFPSCFFI